MRQALAIGLLCSALAACAMPPVGGPPGYDAPYAPARASAPAVHPDDLQAARQACNKAYPAQIGNYQAHADCVNAAVDRYALPGERYPDLVRLQETVRSQLSAQIDQHAISAHDGEQKMAEADRAITAAQRERDASNLDAADQHIAKVQAMLDE